MVQKGKFSAGTLDLVRMLKNVDLLKSITLLKTLTPDDNEYEPSIGQADNTHLKVGTNSTDEWFGFRFFFLLRRHVP